MKKQILILVPLIVLAIACGVVLFSYRPQDDTVAPKIEGKQERTNRVTATATETTLVETPEQVDLEISEIIEHLEALHAPELDEKDEEIPPEPDELADPVAVAWARLEYISQNPQEWGEFSPEAAELMAQLAPTRHMRTEGDMEETIVLLDELGELQDPRSAEIFVNYLRESELWGRSMEEALIAIGPSSVPLLIPLLDDKDRFLRRKRATKLLGIIGSEYQPELGGAVEYILLPKLEQMATSDPHPRVRQFANEAVSKLR